jgi:hypothetical protein
MTGMRSVTAVAAIALAAAGAFGQGAFVQIGTGNIPCGTFGQSCAAHVFDEIALCARMQVLVDASEMTGVAPGTPLLSLALHVTYTNPAVVWPSLRVAVGHTTTTDFDQLGSCAPFGGCPFGWLGGLTTVRAPFTWSPTLGWSTIAFDTPFVWNGVDALVVDLEFDNPSASPNALEHLGLAVDTYLAPSRTAKGISYAGDTTPCPVAAPDRTDSWRVTMRLGLCANATAAPVGAGCSDGNGAGPTLSGTPPFVGQIGTLTISGAAPGAGGALFLGNAAPGPIPLPGGCFFHLANPFVFQFLFTDLSGNWTYSTPLPNAPGVQADLQALIFPAGGSPLFQTTNALHLVLGC